MRKAAFFRLRPNSPRVQIFSTKNEVECPSTGFSRQVQSQLQHRCFCGYIGENQLYVKKHFISQLANEQETYAPWPAVFSSFLTPPFIKDGVDPGFCEEGLICECQRHDKLEGSGKIFKIWNVGDAISWAFRVSLRQKRGFDQTHRTPLGCHS